MHQKNMTEEHLEWGISDDLLRQSDSNLAKAWLWVPPINKQVSKSDCCSKNYSTLVKRFLGHLVPQMHKHKKMIVFNQLSFLKISCFQLDQIFRSLHPDWRV